MVARAVMLAVGATAVIAASACTRGDFHCDSDSECDLGISGRCEADHRCTAADSTCPSGRGYSELSGAQSGACYSDAVTPASLCAAGQPPAVPESGTCIADVCGALPACCETGWSEPCVQLAQIACPLTCDTRIAVTALSGVGDSEVRELWDLRWDPSASAWSAALVTDRQRFLGWLAPPPGQLAPRLVGLAPSGDALLVDDTPVALPADTASPRYDDAVSVDFARAGHDEIVFSRIDTSRTPRELFVERLDAPGHPLELNLGVVASSRWAAIGRDPFPDAVAVVGTDQYALDHALPEDVTTQLLGTQDSDATPNTPPTRDSTWLDLDGDGRLELVVAGRALELYANRDGVLTAWTTIDCEPLTTDLVDLTDPQMPRPKDCRKATSFASTGVPILGGPASLLIGTTPANALYRVAIAATGRPRATAVAGARCATCRGIGAVAARDLDGDHVLDYIAIDVDLGITTALSSAGFGVTYTPPVRIRAAAALREVRIVVTGEPRP